MSSFGSRSALIQFSHLLEKYLNIEKTVKIESVLKALENYSKRLEST